MKKKRKKLLAPDINRCIAIATTSSLTLMILPGILVVIIPVVLGFLLGPNSVAGYIVGIIVSGIQMATSAANSGGAWDNCKKFIKKNGIPVNDLEEAKYIINELRDRKKKGKMVSDEEIKIYQENFDTLKRINYFDQSPRKFIKELKGENMKLYKKAEKASIIGDTVGDPMKDTSGPSLNILIKLSSITSVVFGSFFRKNSLVFMK